MKLSQMDRESKRDYLEKAYDAAVQAHAAGELSGKHPSHQIIAWSKLGGGNATIEDEELPGNPSTPCGNRAHGKTAIDSAGIATMARILPGYTRLG